MTKKYRPYLSLAMMERIVSRCSSPLSPQTSIQEEILDRDIRESLNLMILKARLDITKPAYIPSGDILSSKLGMPISSEEERFLSGNMSAKESEEYQHKLMEQIK